MGRFMTFTQQIEVQTDNVERVEKHVSDWHSSQAGVAPGYRSARILADRGRPGMYLIEVEFDSEADAKKNDERPETNEWANQIRTLVKSEPTYRNLAEVCTTERSS